MIMQQLFETKEGKKCEVRCGGAVVSWLLRSSSDHWSGVGSSPGQGHCVMFFGKTLTLAVPLSTQVYKRVPAKFMLGGRGGGNPAID